MHDLLQLFELVWAKDSRALTHPHPLRSTRHLRAAFDGGRIGARAASRGIDRLGLIVPRAAKATAPGLLGSDPYDELSLGKKQYRANNFGLAEKHFRLAVEKHPRDAEAWLGLAASYDRLRRFDLADRAYAQAIGILGPTVEILNNQGYSYMLRGDYKRAHATLAAALRKDPNNKYVQNNHPPPGRELPQGQVHRVALGLPAIDWTKSSQHLSAEFAMRP